MMDARDLPRPPPAKVVAAETPTLGSLLSLAVGVVVIAALYFGRDVLVPVMLAILLALILAPLVSLLRRIRLGRFPSVIVAVLLAVGVLGFVGTVIGGQVAGLANDAPRYVSNIRTKVASIRDSPLGQLPTTLGRLSRQVGGEPSVPARLSADEPAAPVPVEVRAPPASPFETVRALLAPVVGPLETLLIVFVIAIFILLQREDLRDRMIRLLGSRDLHRTTTAMDEAAARLSRYFLTQLALNAAFGLAVAAGLYFIGVPSPILWGILAGLMRFVPYIGVFIAAIPPIILAAAAGPDWSMAIAVTVLFGVSEPVMGYVVEPLIYGRSTGLSPAAIVIAAIFWTWLWGPIGLILSTPLTLCLVVLGRHVDRLEFLDVLLGDRPALTPPESFYQRMLADDPDEALDQAEALLKQRSLSSYYDEVALEGLELAANDFARGAVSPKQLEVVREAARELIVDLATHDDVEPPPDDHCSLPPSLAERAMPRAPAPDERAEASPLPEAWRREGTVLCIAARGPLDDVAAAIMAQLLVKHGVGGVALSHASATRQQIGELPNAQVLMICICGVAMSGNPSYLRFMVRRLRERLPGVPILVGRWQADPDAANSSIDDGADLGDIRASSIANAVSACVEAASNGQEINDLIGRIDGVDPRVV